MKLLPMPLVVYVMARRSWLQQVELHHILMSGVMGSQVQQLPAYVQEFIQWILQILQVVHPMCLFL